MTAVALVWSLLAGPVLAIHADETDLRAAARWHRVPAIVMLGVAATESGYSGRNDVQGTHGEIGRMQIQVPTARAGGCGAPVRLEDYGYNIACGARILRHCYDRYGSWNLAIRCFNGLALPDGTTVYLERVQREIGRMVVTEIDRPSRVYFRSWLR